MIEIFTLPIFEKKLKQYAKKNSLLITKDYRNLLNILENDPIDKTSIYLKNETYKIRLKNSSLKKGKNKGYRVYYFYRNSENTIILLYIHSKSDESNMQEHKLDKLIMECNIIFNKNISKKQ